jgi:hypothetical protein
MKKVGVGVVIAVLLFAVAGFSYSATRQTAVTPAQFKALQKRVAKLEKTTGALATYTASCLFSWQAVTQYGDPPNTGYVYHDTTGDFLTTALDGTESGQTPDGYIPFTKTAACATPASSVRAALRAAHVRIVHARSLGQHRVAAH